MPAMRKNWLRILLIVVALVAIGLAVRYAMRTEQIPVTVFRVASGTVDHQGDVHRVAASSCGGNSARQESPSFQIT